MHLIAINQICTLSIRLRTYSSFKAALTAGKVSMLGNCPNSVRDSLYVNGGGGGGSGLDYVILLSGEGVGS